MPTARRIFLIGGSAIAVAQTPASDRLHVGVIGSGGQGTSVMREFQKDPSVRISAVCDVYEPNLERALSVAAKAQGGESPRAIRNYRQLLDDKSVHAVVIATPEHWHHRMTLDALAAACAATIAGDTGQHQCDRVRLLGRRKGVLQRQALARWRSAGTLGWLWPAGGGTPVPQSERLQADSGPSP